ncbi:DUF3267 domain-containing protein [Gaoshiqia sp. Z1-71]|uniref:DUF3267 domain-containing protein n=1 Tax=Gaoshiqia hydrogeniformans TaxID=3290090 RepID=UPI003BF865D5
MSRLKPEDLIHSDDFELLAEVEHDQIKQFVLEQISPSVYLIRWFSAYQVAMIALFLFLTGKAGFLFFRGMNEAIQQMGLALLFSFTVLIVLHELIHALAYWTLGYRRLRFGAILKKFVFYVASDQEVIGYSAFRMVALTPFVLVKLACLAGGLFFWSTPYAYFFFSVMCVHSLFCAGDMAMLAFYRIHSDKEIYSFDDLKSGKTFFYFRISPKTGVVK